MIALSLLLGSLLYIFVARLTVYLVGKRTTSWLVKGLVIAIFVLIPTWDILPGRVYFQRLCERDAGVKVFKTVGVDKAFFSADGRPDQKKLAERFDGSMKFDDHIHHIFHIKKAQGSVVDKQTGEVLGTAVNFSYFGGWLSAYLFPQGPPDVCPGYSVYGDLWHEVIRPAQKPAVGGKEK